MVTPAVVAAPPPHTQGKERVRLPLHLQVSSVSPEALRAVERAGGSVTRVYYTQLGLRALLKVRVGGRVALGGLPMLLWALGAQLPPAVVLTHACPARPLPAVCVACLASHSRKTLRSRAACCRAPCAHGRRVSPASLTPSASSRRQRTPCRQLVA
jgi:hypothetical protein